MDKFGFKQLASSIAIAEKNFLHRGMELAKKDFDSNFDKQADPGDEEHGAEAWDELKYRKEPPPILQLTGKLRKASSESGNTVYGGNFAIFTIDPTDKNGRGYAAYHQEGTSKMAMRRTVVQSPELDQKQLALLVEVTDSAFGGRGSFS